MKWQRDHRSDYVEDRRGVPVRAGGMGGGLVFLLVRLVASRFGIGGIVVLGLGYLVVTQVFGVDPAALLGGAPRPPRQASVNDEGKAFVSFVLDDAQATWARKFAASGRHYQPARLVLFSGRVDSACGLASAATGPFYCPRDARVYIDLEFYETLRSRLGAPGDFAQAYVIAHEIGHHVQNLLRVLDGARESGADSRSVRVELQADCFAGIWAHDTAERALLESGDREEAIDAAMAIGDDTLQKQQSGTVRPESFTHGSSAQRKRWLLRGMRAGRVDDCDALSATDLRTLRDQREPEQTLSFGHLLTSTFRTSRPLPHSEARMALRHRSSCSGLICRSHSAGGHRFSQFAAILTSQDDRLSYSCPGPTSPQACNRSQVVCVACVRAAG